MALHRNEQRLGSYTQGALTRWRTGDVEVLFGARHTWRWGVHGRLEASVLGTQLYERALGRFEISTLVCPRSRIVRADFAAPHASAPHPRHTVMPVSIPVLPDNPATLLGP